jgi:hypothetical protein
MVDAWVLRRQARRAYEWGRLRTAAAVAVVVVPLAALSAAETRSLQKSAVGGGLLLCMAIALRWRHRRGAEDATAGLQAGILPMAAALGLCRFAPACPWGLSLGLCAAAALGGGAWLGLHAFGHEDAGLPRWATAVTVAVLTASLGCMALSAGVMMGVVVGLGLGGIFAGALVSRAQ